MLFGGLACQELKDSNNYSYTMPASFFWVLEFFRELVNYENKYFNGYA
jgi:hypothetical protein